MSSESHEHEGQHRQRNPLIDEIEAKAKEVIAGLTHDEILAEEGELEEEQAKARRKAADPD